MLLGPWGPVQVRHGCSLASRLRLAMGGQEREASAGQEGATRAAGRAALGSACLPRSLPVTEMGHALMANCGALYPARAPADPRGLRGWARSKQRQAPLPNARGRPRGREGALWGENKNPRCRRWQPLGVPWADSMSSVRVAGLWRGSSITVFQGQSSRIGRPILIHRRGQQTFSVVGKYFRLLGLKVCAVATQLCACSSGRGRGPEGRMRASRRR